MHPSDSRLSPWDAGDFTIGVTATSSFPGYMWKDVNNGHLVYFKLTAEQITSAKTIRIGITEAFANGRPTITVNGWTSPLPAASIQGGTRSLTVGTYRGNNFIHSVGVPSHPTVKLEGKRG